MIRRRPTVLLSLVFLAGCGQGLKGSDGGEVSDGSHKGDSGASDAQRDSGRIPDSGRDATSKSDAAVDVTPTHDASVDSARPIDATADSARPIDATVDSPRPMDATADASRHIDAAADVAGPPDATVDASRHIDAAADVAGPPDASVDAPQIRDAAFDGSQVTDAGADGDASLPVDAHLATCGNLVIEPGETCDPPNETTCDDSCQSIPVVCGNGIVQPGEQCDLGATSPALCRSCRLTNCGGCFVSTTGGLACTGLSSADSVACNALITCAATGMAYCAGYYGAVGCYCSDPSCSAGANGQCVSQFQALAHSSDPTVVLAQMANPSTPVGQVAKALHDFAHSSCGEPCYVNNY